MEMSIALHPRRLLFLIHSESSLLPPFLLVIHILYAAQYFPRVMEMSIALRLLELHFHHAPQYFHRYSLLVILHFHLQ
ncbi:unnamed protein product [Meloidogyne enterolobii]|uniref:Uncharacterized protein n=1 Tax=Meloidogyne enterolobii TaxID=390850 RepID=A0ACB0ZWN2_MELEN